MSHGQVRVVPFRTRFFAAFSSAWFEPVLLEKGHVVHCHAYSTLHATWFTKADVKNGGHVTKRDMDYCTEAGHTLQVSV